jgi:iron complex transport system substrate-binding protein
MNRSLPRIASLLSSATEILCGLGLQAQLVAISHECDDPAEILSLPRATRTRLDPTLNSRAIDNQVRAWMEAGEPLYEVDQRLLEQLAPDLIVTQAQCDVCAVRLEDVEAVVANSPALRQTRIVSLHPASLSDVLAEIVLLGTAAGVPEVALEYRRQLEARIARIRLASEQLPRNRPRRRVALIEWIEPLMLSGNWMPEIVELAGGEHALTQPGKHSPYLAWDQLLEYDPEVVIVAPCGFDLPRTLQEAAVLTAAEPWKQLSAVRANRAFALDGNAYINRSGPRLVDSLEILAHLIYPEQFPAPDSVPEPARVWCPLV